MTKKIIFSLIILIAILFSCKKKETSEINNETDRLNENTIVVTSSQLQNSLLLVDSTKLVFNKNGVGVSEIKVGSILASDITSVAPLGFLRKVTNIQSDATQTTFATDNVSIEDAVINGSVSLNKTFSDADILNVDSSGNDISVSKKMLNPSGTESLTFNSAYEKIIYDQDGNNSTTNDQIKVEGSIEIQPELDFELEIKNRVLKKLKIATKIKNTNKLKVIAKASIINLHKEEVLFTKALKPFTAFIAGLPVPIAKQWIVLVLGVDGNISAKVTSGAQNINESRAGLLYENGSLSTIREKNNSLQLNFGEFEGNAKVEPSLQLRWELRPYGLKQSRIFVGVKGGIIGEGVLTTANLTITTKWNLKFNAKAQLHIFSRTLLDYEQIFYDEDFPIGNPVVFPLNLQSGLVAYYPFNGNANDASGNGYNGTISNATFGTDKLGNTNSASEYSASNSVINFPNAALNNLNIGSISFWFNTASGNNNTLIDKTITNTENYFQVKHVSNKIQLAINAPYPTTNNIFQSNATLNNNNWHHVVITWNGTEIKMYLNGQLDNTISSTEFVRNIPSVQLRSGNDDAFIAPHSGKIDQIRIYNRVIANSEIQSLFSNY